MYFGHVMRGSAGALMVMDGAMKETTPRSALKKQWSDRNEWANLLSDF